MRVSVIVCTYNREKYLPTTLEKLADQTASKDDYEVLVIDNNSSDTTSAISKVFIDSHPKLDFKYFLETNQGHTFARNRGIVEAKYEILSFIDDDAFVRPDFISTTLAYFQSHNTVSAIGGKIIPVYETSEPKWMSVYLWPLVAALDMGNEPKPFKGAKFPIGANMAYRKEVFGKYGNFDVNLGRRGAGLEGGDEKEMFIRMKRNKEIIHYVPKVIVDHIIPEKRIQMDYIKGLAIGVGTSERRRLANENLSAKFSKVLEELIKIGGTFILSIVFVLQGKISPAWMLIRFRRWVVIGFFINNLN